MNNNISKYLFRVVLVCVLAPLSSIFGQTDSLAAFPEFDSKLLELKVPEAFQRSSLKLEVFSDSSWQLYRGSESLTFEAAMHLLGQDHIIIDYNLHLEKEAGFLKDFRSRRIFSLISSLGGAAYVSFTWSRGWIYQIPGYAAVLIGGVRYLESRRLEIKALREQYYLQSLISPTHVQKLVDDYNFRLYQYLSTAGIQFSDT